MARQWGAEGVQFHETGEEEWGALGVQLKEDQAAPPPAPSGFGGMFHCFSWLTWFLAGVLTK